jgi:hypothetical protein
VVATVPSDPESCDPLRVPFFPNKPLHDRRAEEKVGHSAWEDWKKEKRSRGGCAGLDRWDPYTARAIRATIAGRGCVLAPTLRLHLRLHWEL